MHASDKWIWNQLTGMDLCKMKKKQHKEKMFKKDNWKALEFRAVRILYAFFCKWRRNEFKPQTTIPIFIYSKIYRCFSFIRTICSRILVSMESPTQQMAEILWKHFVPHAVLWICGTRFETTNKHCVYSISFRDYTYLWNEVCVIHEKVLGMSKFVKTVLWLVFVLNFVEN